MNQEKSHQSPAQQQVTYLGFVVDSQAVKLFLPPSKLTQVLECCRERNIRVRYSVREIAKIVGILSATRPAILPALLYYCNLQSLAVKSLRFSTWFNTLVTLDTKPRQDLEWWIHHSAKWNGKSVRPAVVGVTLETDASKFGWGTTCKGSRTGGHWTPQERELHINQLELRT